MVQSCYTLGFMTEWGHPTTLSPRELVLILAQFARDICVRLHFVTGVGGIKKAKSPPVWVGSAGASHTGRGQQKSGHGAGTKGARHYFWTSGTPLVLERAKDMVFGWGAGVGEVARISYVLLLSEPQETG